ncbi:MAG: energy-coupling factor transporter ATPase [Collinsella sp.]|nr:energy-coupling factor transporter ATPase [Collinsella sp.]
MEASQVIHGRGNTVPLIELEGVSFAYPGTGCAGVALDAVTLSIQEGEYVCVLGGNGSGKSTLAQLLNALLAPSDGSARIFGLDPADPRDAVGIRRQTAMVLQHPEDQMVTSIVEDDVAFGPENLGVPPALIARRVRDSLDAVDMLSCSRSDPADLSGGQKQRVAMAGALAMEPRLLVLDEPAAMLDTEGRESIRAIIRDLSARGMTIVHVTHFMEDALGADRVVALDRGRVSFDGCPGDFFHRTDLVRSLKLELPASMQLLHAVGRLAGGVDPMAPAMEIARQIAERTSPSRIHPRRTGRHVESGCPPLLREGIRFEHVSFSYADAPSKRSRLPLFGRKAKPRSHPLALDGVSLTVEGGSLTALVGRTGSGKSTAVELACALKTPTAGSVLVGGVDTSDLCRRGELRRLVGYVSQLPERQLFAENVFDDVAFGPRNLGLPEDEVRKRVETALEQTGLEPDPELLGRSPFSLSGGQQRCVALAGVLAMRQPILVLDEPMAGLDPMGRKRISRLLRLLHDQGTTLLVVTHSMDDVAHLADHVIALDGGSVIADGTPHEVFATPRVPATSHRLGEPAGLEIARELVACGMEIDQLPLTIEDLAEEVLAHGAAR